MATEIKKVDFFGLKVPEDSVQSLKDAIASKDIEVKEGHTPTSGDDKGKYVPYTVTISSDIVSKYRDDATPVSHPFTELNALTMVGAELLSGSKKEVLQHFNDDFNNYRRQQLRQKMVFELEGPERAIKQMAKQLAKILNLSEEDSLVKAREFVANQATGE